MLKLEELILKPLKDYNDTRLKELYDNAAPDNFNFILGAGVSMSLGYPGWNTIISQTIGSLLPQFLGSRSDEEKICGELEALLEQALTYDISLSDDNKKFIKGVKGDYSSVIRDADLLEAAEYIYNYIYEYVNGGSNEIKRGVASKKLLSLIRRAMFTPETELQRRLDEKYRGSTIESVVNIIKKSFGDEKTRRDVITYNYDNLIEYCLINKAGVKEDDLLSISHTDIDKTPKDNKINILHVHGKFNVHNLEDASENIILSESSYHNIEKQDYLWSHTLQANAMLNKTCLFVGFSAQDYNFRRIVRNSDSIKNCYILFTVDELVKDVFGDIIDQKYKEERIRKILSGKRISGKKRESELDKLISESAPKEAHDRLLKDILSSEEYSYEKLLLTFLIYSHTKYWENMNINPIWTTIKELPRIINELTTNNTKSAS